MCDQQNQIEIRKGCAIVRVQGCLNHELGFKLQRTLDKQAPLARQVLIDLSGIDYLDSSGLGCLVSLQISLKHKQRDVVLTGLKRDVKEVLKSSQLYRLFQTRETLDEAMAEFCERD